jgi:hypothetical protein
MGTSLNGVETLEFHLSFSCKISHFLSRTSDACFLLVNCLSWFKRTLMPSLFDATEATNISSRIRKLTPDAKPKWGKMNVAQMLAHCQAPLNVALGRETLKRSIFGFLFGKLAKKSVVSEKPFKRNLPTAPSFIVKEQRDFEAEQAKLLDLVDAFANGGEQGLTKDPHPFFGAMTPGEWDTSQWKHLDHHLQQFGV